MLEVDRQDFLGRLGPLQGLDGVLELPGEGPPLVVGRDCGGPAAVDSFSAALVPELERRDVQHG